MQVQRVAVTVTSIADGSATAFSDNITGRILQIRYVKASSGSYTDGYTVTMTAEITGESIWSEAAVNSSATRAPRQALHTIAGAAALYAAGGVAVLEPIALASDRVKIVLASAGDTKTGTFYFIVG